MRPALRNFSESPSKMISDTVVLAENPVHSFARVMRATSPMARIRSKVRRALRTGKTPLEIARKLGIPLLMIAEIATWGETLKQIGGRGMDS